MLMILARLVRSESFWAVAKVRSPHTGPGISYIINGRNPATRTASTKSRSTRTLAGHSDRQTECHKEARYPPFCTSW